jgi:hypothetical protein
MPASVAARVDGMEDAMVRHSVHLKNRPMFE